MRKCENETSNQPCIVILQVDAVQSIDEGLQRVVALFGLELAGPQRERMPSHHFELLTHFGVSLDVAPYLLHPKGGVGLRYLAALGTLNLES